MSKVFYTITNSEGKSGLSLTLGSGETYSVESTHEKYKEILTHLLDEVNDDTALLGLVMPFHAMFHSYATLSERVSRKGYKLFFDGDPVNTDLAKFIVDRIDSAGVENKDAWMPYVRFMEKLATNPSEESQKHLFHFVRDNGITLFDDGDLLFYKGVTRDMLSTREGFAIVDGVEFGSTNEDRTEVLTKAFIPQALGSTVEIPRGMVDTDRRVGCSTGLHVGSWAYASSFSAITTMVKVHPRSIVAVPSDYENQKVRATGYTTVMVDVLEEFDEDIYYGNPLDEVDAPEVEVIAPTIVVNISGLTSLDDSAKVAEFVSLIKNELLPKGVNVRKYKNKRITSARRSQFQAAMDILDIK